jgi:hypothetical protein
VIIICSFKVVMSKTKGQTFRYRFENEAKTYRSRICLVENRLFRYGPESVLLNQIDMTSFDGADSKMKTQTFWFNSCWMLEHLWNVCGTFVLYSFDLTTFNVIQCSYVAKTSGKIKTKILCLH